MDPLYIVLMVLAAVAVWAVVELARIVRRAHAAVDTLEKTLDEVQGAVAEARPVIAKVDESLEALQPALEQIEPLLKQGGVAVEALSADLVEVNGLLRDVSNVTESVSSASGAVSGIASAASEKVQRFLGRKDHRAGFEGVAEPALSGAATSAALADSDDASMGDSEQDVSERQYYIYTEGAESSAEDQED